MHNSRGVVSTPQKKWNSITYTSPKRQFISCTVYISEYSWEKTNKLVRFPCTIMPGIISAEPEGLSVV